ncbi:hypothetical protein K502DRAFT_336503 [Neoconidiobolus thromboides FSU 785]|nr:hypothetical protein K502DRAFT_336503 [Neoconidiobolus thromboides FSU 785]
MSSLAVKTTTSGSLSLARKRVFSQYRQWLRSAPEIVQLYTLDFPSSIIKQKVREEYEKNRYVKDLRAIDILLFKGQSEYEETMNLWKQVDQLLFYFMKEESPAPPQTFLDKFYQGRD